MSRFEDMRQVAVDAQKNWIDRNARTKDFIVQLVRGWQNYCNTPDEHLVFLKSNGADGEDRRFERVESAGIHGIFQAIDYDEAEDEWRFGVCLRFSRPGVSPELNVSFGIFATEIERCFRVRIGPGKMHTVDPNVQSQREEFFQELEREIKDSFKAGPTKQTKEHGFAVHF